MLGLYEENSDLLVLKGLKSVELYLVAIVMTWCCNDLKYQLEFLIFFKLTNITPCYGEMSYSLENQQNKQTKIPTKKKQHNKTTKKLYEEVTMTNSERTEMETFLFLFELLYQLFSIISCLCGNKRKDFEGN